MKRVVFATTLIFCLSAFVFTDNNKTFKKLYALEGLWKMTTKRGVVFEEWKKINKDSLHARSYSLKGTDTIVNERITLTNTKEGIYYTPAVENQNNKQPIAFKMSKADDHVFVFENPEHDFPKRIVYRFVTTDSLHAFVDDGTEEEKKQNFYFKRQ